MNWTENLDFVDNQSYIYIYRLPVCRQTLKRHSNTVHYTRHGEQPAFSFYFVLFYEIVRWMFSCCLRCSLSPMLPRVDFSAPERTIVYGHQVAQVVFLREVWFLPQTLGSVSLREIYSKLHVKYSKISFRAYIIKLLKRIEAE